MNSEYLPATGRARQDLVLLHGWGSNREIWRPLLVALRPWANITLVDIPGCAPGCPQPDEPTLPEALTAIMARCPDAAVYVGWSLGGQLAAELAARYPERVTALVTICSNPKFVATPDWPGMERAALAGFHTAAAADPAGALRRFYSLQVSGAVHPRSLLRELARLVRAPATARLLAGLEWLRDLDQRACLPTLAQPQLHLSGARDGLVPAGVGPALERLLHGIPGARVRVLGQASHLAPLDASAELAAEIPAFLAAAGLLRSGRSPVKSRVKQEVAASFSRAASRYDSVAVLQRDVGTRLLNSLESLTRGPSTILDLGCGTGHFQAELQRRYPGADYIGLDIARGMVEHARAHSVARGMWLVGDAEALPLAANSVDLVFSSLAIQWCDSPQHLFAELARILRPGGCCVFTSLGPDTLRELRAAWAAVDAHQHVNTFVPRCALEAAARAVPGTRLGLQSERICMRYRRVRDLLDELKTLGAHNMNSDRPAGLTSRRALQGMLAAYEGCREDGLLPATYDVIFGTLETE